MGLVVKELEMFDITMILKLSEIVNRVELKFVNWSLFILLK